MTNREAVEALRTAQTHLDKARLRCTSVGLINPETILCEDRVATACAELAQLLEQRITELCQPPRISREQLTANG